MNALLQTMRNFGPARLAAMGGVTIALIGFFIYLMLRLSTPEMSLLYSDLDTTDSGAIAAKLDELKVPYEVAGNGGSILVPADQALRLRLTMAQEGLPSGGSIGYEIFDKSDGFGTTSFIQNLNRLRALEGEIARTIGTIGAVRSARVHLVLPERELFAREQQPPSASVFLQLRRSGLTAEQIMAIQHLVAASVPKLQPQNVSIVDDNGNLLARGPEGSPADLRMTNAETMRRTYEQKLKDTVEQLLSRSVGYGRVRAQVTADMDFDRVTTSAERFDPNGQVPRSTQFIEEEEKSSDGSAIDPVSVATNLPEADVPATIGGAGASGTSATRVEETTNYEISKVVENTVREGGRVRRLSVAVLVDGVYRPGADGEIQYAERPEEEMAKLEALVKSAVGFDPARGDTIEVVNMRFVSPDDEIEPLPQDTILGMQRDDLFRLVELLVLAVVAGLVVMLVIRPLLGRLLDGTRPVTAGSPLDALLPDPMAGQRPALAPPGMAQLTGPDGMVLSDDEEADPENLIDIQQVEGRVRASSLKKVGEIVEKHPEEAASIIRNWLYQES